MYQILALVSLSKLKFKVIPYEITEKTPKKLNILSIDTSKKLGKGIHMSS